jgi:hypothetical protein
LENWLDVLSEPQTAQMIKKEISGVRQASDMLMMPKQSLLDEKVRNDVCGSLTAKQIYRLLQNYTPDEYDTEKVSNEVLSAFQNLVNEENKLNTPSSNNAHNANSKPDGSHSRSLSNSGDILVDASFRFPVHFETATVKKSEAELMWDSSNRIDIPPDILCKDAFSFLKQPLNDLFI